MAFTQLPERLRGERVLLTREGALLLGHLKLPSGDRLPADRLTQQPDACRVERHTTSASEWFVCVRHRWCERLAVGTVRALSCPHEGR